MHAHEAFLRLYEIIVALRGPDGCPWDREQTPESLRGHLLEETYECIESIESGDTHAVVEELGDVLLLVLMIARIYEERGEATVSGIIRELDEKLIRRHPHVFGESDAATTGEVLEQWERIKVEQEGKAGRSVGLNDVSRALPSLERAAKLQKKAAQAGFDWPVLQGVLDKIEEETGEIVTVLGAQALSDDRDRLSIRRAGLSVAELHTLEDEVGDLLFSAVNLSRYLGVDPSVALNRANRKFVERFNAMEVAMAAQGLELSAQNLDAMDRIWNAQKLGREESSPGAQ